MTSYRAGDQSFLSGGFSGLAEAPPTTWEQYRRILRGAGRAVIRDSYPTELASAAHTVQQPVATGRRIAVLTPSGGTGASLVSSLLAVAYNGLRRDLIGLVDLNNLTSGIPQWVAEKAASPRSALGSLAVGQPTRREEFRRALGLTENQIAVVRTDEYEAPLDARATETLLSEFTRQCAITLVECPPGGDDERMETAFTKAHTVLVVLDLTQQGMHEGKVLIDRMREVERQNRQSRRERPRPMLVVANERTATLPNARRGARHLAVESGARMVTFRHDRKLRSPEPLTLDHLEQATKLDILRIGALALTLTRADEARAALAKKDPAA